MLGIDLRCLPSDGSAGGGVAHAARAITKELVQRMGKQIVAYLPNGASCDGVKSVVLADTRRTALVHALQTHPCDLLFVPSGAVSPRLPFPAIPLVHDLDIFDHPEWFPQSWLKRQVTTRLFLSGIRRAPHVFAVSDYTRDAIKRYAPNVADRITVTGEGGDAELAAIPLDQLSEKKNEARSLIASRGIERRFVLILGTLEPRKNIPFIAKLWPEVARNAPGIDLVIAGQDGWKLDSIRAALVRCSSELESLDSRIIRLQEFSEQDRRALLLAADLVLVPSLSEGFGLVALEAVQAGTPVLASDRGGLPEVLGKGDWLLDPEDPAAWRQMIIQLLQNEVERGRMCEVQRARRDVFSWSKTVEVILAKFFS